MARRSRSGPANLSGMGPGLKARVPAVRQSRASMPTPRAGFTSGATPPAGGGQARTGNPITRPQRKINRSKTGGPSGFNRTPRADGVSRI